MLKLLFAIILSFCSDNIAASDTQNAVEEAKEALASVCPDCLTLLNTHETLLDRELSIEEMAKYLKSEDFLLRSTILDICPKCYKALIEHEKERGDILTMREVVQLFTEKGLLGYISDFKEKMIIK